MENIGYTNFSPISYLKSLKHLILKNNQYTQVPLVELYGISTLNTLDISHNSLTSIPENIFSEELYPNLLLINASSNQISSISSSWAMWSRSNFNTSYKYIDVSSNVNPTHLDFSLSNTASGFISFPSGIRLVQPFLISLNLSGQGFVIVPGTIGGFSQLEVLDLSFNRVYHLPNPEFCQLINLKTLNLSGSYFGLSYTNLFNSSHGTPSCLDRLKSLSKIDLSSAFFDYWIFSDSSNESFYGLGRVPKISSEWVEFEPEEPLVQLCWLKLYNMQRILKVNRISTATNS